jgi:hypothetical protein
MDLIGTDRRLPERLRGVPTPRLSLSACMRLMRFKHNHRRGYGGVHVQTCIYRRTFVLFLLGIFLLSGSDVYSKAGLDLNL